MSVPLHASIHLCCLFVLRPRHDFILHWFGQLYKVGAVTGHPYNEIPMFFRMLLGIQQYLFIDNIKLNMFPPSAEVGLYQSLIVSSCPLLSLRPMDETSCSAM